jgi:hypothetical protein
MSEQKYCPVCGEKMAEGEVCKKCKADSSEKMVADCRGARYANSFIVSAYVNLVLTNRRLLAFEDKKGAVHAGVIGGAKSGLMGQSGLLGAAIGATAASVVGSPTERVVVKGLNGSVKFEVLLSSIVGVQTESKKNGVHTFVNVVNQKSLRVVLGASFDGVITGDMFREMLVNATRPK